MKKKKETDKDRGQDLRNEQQDNNSNKQEGHQHQEGGMGKRGVTRPMMHMKKGHNKKEEKQDNEGKKGGHSMMSNEQRKEMLHMHHMQTLWIYWMLVILGIWMVASPLTFDYGKNVVEPSGGRDVWLSMSGRIAAIKMERHH